MKEKIIFLLCFAIPLLCVAQITPNNLTREYEYDASGNRTSRKVIDLTPPQLTPPASPPENPNLAEAEPVEPVEEFASLASLPPLTSLASLTPLPFPEEHPEYFIEKIARVEIKIYPNPTTENITLEIPGWQDLQTGIFKLFSATGQLLQEQPVHNVATTVSLSGLPKGTYILKVYINDRTEDWKVIKN